MTWKWALGVALAGLPLGALAQTTPPVLTAGGQPAAANTSGPLRTAPPPATVVPALIADPPVGQAPSATPADPPYAPPPLPPPLSKEKALSAQERAGVVIAKEWVTNAVTPAHGEAGSVMFGFGETLPDVVCAPLYVCDIELEPGEIVNDITIGDSVRWKVMPSGSGDVAHKITHVLVKPTDAGLMTNLVITTDKRTYVIKLVSRAKDWMPRVTFSYPGEERAAWEGYLEHQRLERQVEAARQAQMARATVLPEVGLAIDHLDFDYIVRGDKPLWKPLRVYSDGKKTYIEFPARMDAGEAPALVGIGSGDAPEVINYRKVGDRYIVDQVLDRGALISGVGRAQVKVEILHGSSRL
jgi:type IV secretion system protein VirB9